jgi:hypothetical protein
MGNERVNVEVMFARPDDEDPIISVRLREWSAGRNAGRMILAGGRTLDEAVAYAYNGLCDNAWLPIDWKLRAAFVGVVNSVMEKPIPVRPRIALSAILTDDDDPFLTDTLEPGGNVPQNGAQNGPGRNSSKDKSKPTAS